jgi:hypothetical protein
MKQPWNEIYDQKKAEGYSHERAYELAREEMDRRREAFSPETIIGLPEEEAKALMAENGYTMRVIKRDVGRVGNIYLDLSYNRRNVSIKKGKVAKIISVG